MDQLRAGADAVLCGSGSLRADNAKLYDRRNPDSPKQPVPVIFSASGQINPDWNAFGPPHPPAIIVCNRKAGRKIKNLGWKGNMPELYTWQGFQELPEFLTYLFRERKIKSILVEGGPKLNFYFFEYNLVNEMYITVVPFISGGHGKGTVDGVLPGEYARGKLKAFEKKGDEIFLKYKFK
jgi:5-amino-6-(5-phosphoribosylamino)uracil reductase